MTSGAYQEVKYLWTHPRLYKLSSPARPNHALLPAPVVSPDAGMAQTLRPVREPEEANLRDGWGEAAGQRGGGGEKLVPGAFGCGEVVV